MPQPEDIQGHQYSKVPSMDVVPVSTMSNSTEGERTDTIDGSKESKGRENSENGAREKIPLLPEEDVILLTPALEEEIIGPESFTRCGIGWLTNEWLQKLARPETYLVVFSLAAFAQGIFFTYSTGTLSTVERRFKLPSSVSGFISTGNDILQLFLSIPLAYAAGYGHRPRWLGGGLLLSAIGSFFIMSPHIIFGAGDHSYLATEQFGTTNETSNSKKDWAYCGSGLESEVDCTDGSAAVGIEQYAVAALQFSGQAMSGLANVCFYVVGYSYLDEAVSKDKVPLYFAVSGCMRIFGPVVGAGLASYTVGLWVELGVTPVINPSHPQWVGAWWLGYPIIMLFLILASVPMMLMPRQLPGARARTLTRLRVTAKQGKEAFAAYKESLRPLGDLQFKKMLPGFRRLSRNKLFLLIMTNQTLFWFGVVGYFMFQMKYMENQFKVTAAEANRASALAGIMASLVGWLGMGSLLTFLKPSSKSIMYITMAVSLCCMTAYVCQMNVKCQRDQVIGLDAVLEKEKPLNELYTSTENHPSVDEGVLACMSNCSCPDNYSPVCVNGTHLFLSACHAGCTQKLTVNGSLMFGDCTCTDLLDAPSREVTGKAQTEVRSGVCSTSCDSFVYYVAFKVTSGMFVSSNRVIANILFFRSVDERDKDLALGILNLILSLAFVFVPIFVGGLVDYSCILWQRTCGRRGYCYLYDMDKYRWILHGIPTVGMVMSFLTEVMILRYHESIDFFGQKEMEQLQLVDLLLAKRKKRKEKKKKTKGDSMKDSTDAVTTSTKEGDESKV